MGITIEPKQLKTTPAKNLKISDTFQTIENPVSFWIVSDCPGCHSDTLRMAVNLSNGKSKCLDNFSAVIPVDLIVTETK